MELDITTLTQIVGSLSALTLALVAVIAFTKGWVVPASVIEKIIAQTVVQVIESENSKAEAEDESTRRRISELFEELSSQVRRHNEAVLGECQALRTYISTVVANRPPVQTPPQKGK